MGNCTFIRTDYKITGKILTNSTITFRCLKSFVYTIGIGQYYTISNRLEFRRLNSLESHGNVSQTNQQQSIHSNYYIANGSY